MSNLLRTSIEIAASPEAVRAKFLDFPALPSYSRFFESVESGGKRGVELEKGDTVVVKIVGTPGFKGKVETNTPLVFAWTGSLPFVFTGTHTFYWTPSEVTPGGTTFVQEERFTGLLGSLLYGDGMLARRAGMKEKTRKGWEMFNADLKGVVEAEGRGE